MSAPFLLVSEARGEYLVAERIRAELERLGRPAVHVTPHADDVTDSEQRRSGVIVLEQQPDYRRALALAPAALAVAVAEEQRDLDVNLRRVWRADLRSWREGFHDEAMARIAVGCLRAWRAILGQVGDVSGLWGEDGGHLAKRTAFALAERSGIPIVFTYVSPLPGRLLVIDNALNRFDPRALSELVVADDDRAYAQEVLEAVRASRVQFAVPRDLTFRIGRVARFAHLVVDRYVRRPPGAKSLHPFGFARSYARQRAGRAALRLAYRPLGSRPFVFHPIHAGFDAQISVRAPQWENQLALVEHVAASLPYGYELAIKEHPFEVGALPPARLASLLRRRPEIRLLDPAIHAHRILPRCAAVTTINSTTGFEGLFFRRPVVTFGNGPYRGLGLTHDVHDPFDSPRVLLDALSSPPVDEEEVIRLVTFLLRNSRPAIALNYDVSDENVRRHAELFAEAAERGAATAATR